MDSLEFRPISPLARSIINSIIKEQSRLKILGSSLLCVCLGPGKRHDNYSMRVNLRKFIQEKNHTSFFLEDLNIKEKIELFKRTKVPENCIDAVCKDENLLNEYLVKQCDIVFILFIGEGPKIEFGKYTVMVPHKIRALVHEKDYFPNSQLDLEMKSLRERNPDCLITYSDNDDLFDKIDRCLQVETRKRFREGLYEKSKNI